MNLKKKLTIGIGLLTVIPLVILGITLSSKTATLSGQALERAVKNQLVSLRELKQTQVESYFASIQSQIVTYSNNLMIVDAMNDFQRSFANIEVELNSSSTEQAKASLAQYYQQEFNQTYRRNNLDKDADWKSLINQLEGNALHAQAMYISDNPNALGEKHLLNHQSTSATYNNAHAVYHPAIRSYLEEFGYYDIFLVDARSGDIVYSVFKEIDFGTSLLTGPFANTGIGKAFQQAKQLDDPNEAVLVDFSRYLPSYEAPASFIASPITSRDGERIGILIFQMPVDRINTIMTNDREWQEVGLGLSGETYLVGPDYLARSESRFLLEDPKGYRKTLISNAVDEALADEIIARGSNLGLQSIKTSSVKKALAGQEGYHITNDYRDVAVLSAYTNLDIDGLNWVLLSEIDKSEAFADAFSVVHTILLWLLGLTFLFSVISLSLANWFAGRTTTPIIELSKTLQHVAQTHSLTSRVQITSTDEIGNAARSFNSMMDSFQQLVTEILNSTTILATSTTQLTAVSDTTNDAVNIQKQEIDQISAAMHEMVATVAEVARNTNEASAAAEQAEQHTSTSNKTVRVAADEMVNLGNNLEQSSSVIAQLDEDTQKIGQVLDVISAIAAQTNLLALNAAIEAARAGEQGRGFAVVADEVRTLAARTQDSTEEITHIIESLQSRAKLAVDSITQNRSDAIATIDKVKQTSATLSEITELVHNISTMSIQIATAAEEQHCVAEEMNRNLASITQSSDSTANSAMQTYQASQELTRVGQNLSDLIRRFAV